MTRNRAKYVHDEHCLSLTHDGDCDCPRPRTLRQPDSSPHGSTGRARLCVAQITLDESKLYVAEVMALVAELDAAHAEGRAAGRDEALREVVGARAETVGKIARNIDAALGAIEARFPSEGMT